MSWVVVAFPLVSFIVGYQRAVYFTLRVLLLFIPKIIGNGGDEFNTEHWRDGYNEVVPAKSMLWNPPSVPVASIFFSPCNFPMFPFVNHHGNQRYYKSEELEGISICHIHKYTHFICDLHRSLNHYAAQSVAQIYHKHLPVLRQKDGSPSLVILVVRQLIQPSSSNYITRNSSDFGCLFQIPCEPMTPDKIHKFVKNTKIFTKIYTAALFRRWFSNLDDNSKNACAFPRLLALVLLDGVLPNPKKVASVNLYTDNASFVPFIPNLQTEATNMLIQGVPLVDVLRELVDQIGYALLEFQINNGQIRRYIVPPWALHLGALSIVLVILALTAEWIVVRRHRKVKGRDVGKIKAVIKSKTHMIF